MHDHLLQVDLDFHQWMVGFYWAKQIKIFNFGPITIRITRMPTFEDFFEQVGDMEHDFQPVEGELGKYECTGCGEIRVSPELN